MAPSPTNPTHLRVLAHGVRGGADDLPPIPDVPEGDALAEMDEESLRALHTELDAAYAARRPLARGHDDTQALASIREAQRRIVGQVSEIHANEARLREADQAEVALPEAPADLSTLAETPPGPTEPPMPGNGGEGNEGGDGNADDENAQEGGDGATAPSGLVPATAAAGTLGAGDFASTGNAAPPNARPERPRAALVAAAGPHGVPVGTDVGADMGALGRAITETLSALRPGRDGSSMRARVATIAGYEDMGDSLGVPLLGSGNAEQNTAYIHEAVASYQAGLHDEFDGRYGGSPLAATAAICDPLDIIRQIPDCTTDAEPFSDTLPGRPAGRLGFQFMASSILGDVTAGVTIWDEAEQAAVVATDQGTWKPCVLVTCPPVSEVTAEAVTACLLFDNTTEMSSPERVADFMAKIAAAKARAKEDRLLQIASTFTHRYRHVGEYGAVPASVLAVLTTLEQGWATNRLDEGTLYNWYVPKELLSAWVIDLVGQAFLQDPSVVRDVRGFMEDTFRGAGKNVRIVPLLDRSITPTLPIIGGVAEEYLESGIKSGPYETYLIPPEGAIYFSTGEINVGVERSPELMRQNRAQWFMEEYVGLSKHGCQPWYRLELDVCENGTRAALTTPWTCEGAS